MRAVRAVLPASTRLMVLVRCRGGDFAYTRDELHVSQAALRHCCLRASRGDRRSCLRCCLSR